MPRFFMPWCFFIYHGTWRSLCCSPSVGSLGKISIRQWSLKSWELMQRQVTHIWQVINGADCVCLKHPNPSWQPEEQIQTLMSSIWRQKCHAANTHTHTCSGSNRTKTISTFLHEVEQNYLINSCSDRIWNPSKMLLLNTSPAWLPAICMLGSLYAPFIV